MPYANVPKKLWPKMDRCVKKVMADNEDLLKKNAVAICYVTVMGKKAKEVTYRVTWTRAYVNSLADNAFLHIEAEGKKVEGKTVPRSLRHLPYRNKDGAVDLPHLRAALSRLGQPKTGKGWLTKELRARLVKKARAILKKQKKDKKAIGRKMSLSERVERIRSSFYAQVRQPRAAVYTDFYVIDVFEDYVITRESDEGTMWRVGYNATDEEITFEARDKWRQVTQEYVPVKAKKTRAKAKLILSE